jgi:hypothetical protein
MVTTTLKWGKPIKLCAGPKDGQQGQVFCGPYIFIGTVLDHEHGHGRVYFVNFIGREGQWFRLPQAAGHLMTRLVFRWCM